MIASEPHHWIGAVFVTVLTFVVLLTARETVRIVKARVAIPGRFGQYAADVATRRTPLVLLGVFAGCLGALALPLDSGGWSVVRAIFTIALTVQMGIWLSSIVTHYLAAADQLKGEQDHTYTVVTFAGYFAKTIIWSLALMVMLSAVGIDITAFVASAGVGGVAMALAAQSFLRDYVSGIAIMLDQPFKVGDFITVDDCRGTVEQIGVRTTWVRSFEGERLIFSNSDLMSSRIRNFGGMDARQGIFRFEVDHDTPTKQLRSALTEICVLIASLPGVVLKRAHFKDITESGIVFEALFTVHSGDYAVYLDRRQQIILQTLNVLERHNIHIARGRRTAQGDVAGEDDEQDWPKGWLHTRGA